MISPSIHVRVEVPNVAAGVVHAIGVSEAPSSPDLAAALDVAIARARAWTDADVEEVRRAVRDMLRHGKYKPTGRGKPASEYLLQSAREDRFPRISRLVDVNNLVSLETLLPISIVDVDRAGARELVVRRGRAGESYVFNSAGHAIELEDLLLAAVLPDDRPCANPVRDSMETKVAETTREVVAIVYAPAALRARLEQANQRLAAALESWCGASATSARVEEC